MGRGFEFCQIDIEIRLIDTHGASRQNRSNQIGAVMNSVCQNKVPVAPKRKRDLLGIYYDTPYKAGGGDPEMWMRGIFLTGGQIQGGYSFDTKGKSGNRRQIK